jgi:hypothetical protein
LTRFLEELTVSSFLHGMIPGQSIPILVGWEITHQVVRNSIRYILLALFGVWLDEMADARFGSDRLRMRFELLLAKLLLFFGLGLAWRFRCVLGFAD